MTDNTTTQLDLDGEEAAPARETHADERGVNMNEHQRIRPTTMLYCSACEDWLFRGQARGSHPHVLVNATTERVARRIEQYAACDLSLDAEPGDVLVVGDRSNHPSDIVVFDTSRDMPISEDPRTGDAAISGSTTMDDSTTDVDDEEQTKIADRYEVTLSYSVDYRIEVAAWSESEAKSRAQEKKRDEDVPPSSADHVHTRVDKRGEVHEDDDLAEEYEAV